MSWQPTYVAGVMREARLWLSLADVSVRWLSALLNTRCARQHRNCRVGLVALHVPATLGHDYPTAKQRQEGFVRADYAKIGNVSRFAR